MTIVGQLSFSQWCIECGERNDFTLEKILTEGKPRSLSFLGWFTLTCSCCLKSTFSFYVSDEALARFKKQKESRP